MTIISVQIVVSPIYNNPIPIRTANCEASEGALTKKAESASPRSFPLFTCLPPELRLQIWTEAIKAAGPSTWRRVWNRSRGKYALQGQVPPVLHACRETRKWFIQEDGKTDKRGLKFQLVQQRQGSGSGLYVNWARDEVQISSCDKLTPFETVQFQDVRFLVMNWGARCWTTTSAHLGVKFIRSFPRLQRLTLVVRFDQQAGGTEVARLEANDGPSSSTSMATKDEKLRVKRSQNSELFSIAELVVTEFEKEQKKSPEWLPPALMVECGD